MRFHCLYLYIHIAFESDNIKDNAKFVTVILLGIAGVLFHIAKGTNFLLQLS